MGRLVLLMVALSAVVVLASCAMASSPVTGMWYTEVKAPLTVTSYQASPRVGKAECTSILGLVATGDASIEAAAKNGQITKIHHVDYEAMSVLGIFAKFTTIVWGE